MKFFSSLTALAVILYLGAAIAWFVNPSRNVDWIPLFVTAIAVTQVIGRANELDKRLKTLEEALKSK